MQAKKRGRLGALLGAMLVAAGVTAACGDSADNPEGAAGSPMAGAGGGGAAAGGSAGRPQAGDGGSGGEQPICDCGDDPRFVHVPLDCACAAGLCTTLAEDLPRYVDGQFGWPYYALRGTCASGHQMLLYDEACENSGARTYDAQGNLVYSSYGPYGNADAVCGPGLDSAFGDFGIGTENPAKDCTFCLLSYGNEDGVGAGGAAADSCIDDDLAMYEPCEP